MPQSFRIIPDDFARTIAEVHGEKGRQWLADLPALLADLEQRWGLTVNAPFPNLSYNYVAPTVTTEGVEVVLKVGVPNPELASECAALRLYDGRGSVGLRESDARAGALLLERLRPGAALWDRTDDEQSTAIAASVLKQLRRPAPREPYPFPTVEDWADGLARMRHRFGGGTGPLPAVLVDQAEALFRDLLATSDAPALLHGDLHHGNILSAERAPWLAIDPKGLIGEPAYDTGAWLRNPLPQLLNWPSPKAVLARRIAIFAETLTLDPARIQAWGMAQAVLSAWWTVEDHGYGWEPALALAELLA